MQSKQDRGKHFLELWRQMPLSLTLVLASFLVFLPTAGAQVSATLNGTVTDATGAVIPGANVVLTNDATKETRTGVSNDSGTSLFRPCRLRPTR